MGRVLLCSLLTPLLALLVAPAFAQTAAERFHTAEARWSAHHPEGTVLDDGSAAAREALTAMWSAVADLALGTLRAQPEISPDAFATALTSTLEPKPDRRLGPRLSATAVKLPPFAMAVAFNRDAAGTVFILGPGPTSANAVPSSGPAAPVLIWSMASTPAPPVDAPGLLRAWAVPRQGELCREAHHGANPDGTCGPLTGSLTELPADGADHARFLLDATYSQDAGATFGKQASVWAWDGVQPRLLWINLYDINADQRFGMRFGEGVLEIGEKGAFKTFFTCGSCDGRQLIHTLRLTDAGVDDMGTRSTVPELDAADHLFLALASSQATSELAAPAVVNALLPLLTRAKSHSAEVASKGDGQNFFSVGLLDSSSVHTTGGLTAVCLVTDALGHVDLTLEHHGNQLFVSHASTPAGKPQPCQ